MGGRESLEQNARAAAQSPKPASHGGWRLHPDHAFGGMEIVDSVVPPAIVARCECGAALDVAIAVFATCPRCSGRAGGCRRCGDTGEVVDHAALEWSPVEEWRQRHGGLI
jgi:hypothetical protein